MNKKTFILLMFIAVLAFGCAPKRVTEIESDESLYNLAVQELTKKNQGFPYIFSGTDYERIFNLLKEIQIRYTYSPYATLAELRTADAYFKQEEYAQASFEYQEFIARHPNHEETPYATFRLGLSNYKQMKGIDRDPTFTREAVRWLDSFMRNYPDSPLIDEAGKMRTKARERLAAREIYIGNYYIKRNNYMAAVKRFKTVVSSYEDTGKLEEALFRMGQSYFEMNETELAKDALERVVAQFPKAEFHEEAAELLAEIGNRDKRKAQK